MKKVFAVSLCLILSVLCVACAKNEAPAETVAQTEAPTEALAEASTQAETVAETEAETQAKTAAAAATPNWRELKTVDSPKVLHPIVTSMGEGGQTEENFTVFNMSYPIIELPEQEAAAYPALATALSEDLNNYTNVTAAEDRQRIEENYDPAMQNDEYFNGLSMDSYAGILRADENFFSALITTDAWLGGAHPSTSRRCFTYSTQDGSLIVPSDVFTSKAELISVLKEKLKAIPDVDYFDLDNDLEQYEFECGPMADKVTFNMGITEDGIVFFFNQYELAPYACGEQIITLPYAEYASIINPDFAKTASSYAYPVIPYTEVVTKAGTLVVSGGYNDYGTITKIKLSVNGNEKGFDSWTYHLKPHVIQKGDKTFVYVFEDGDDDDEFIHVFDITGGTATEVKQVELRLNQTSKEEESTQICGARCWARSLTSSPVVDPEVLILDKGAVYKVGDDGVPVQK